MSFRSALRPALRPALASLSGLSIYAGIRHSSSSSSQVATCTRWLVRDAWSGAPRECPTPLVLLRTPGLSLGSGGASVGVSKATEETWYEWADMFATRGYTTVEVDVSVASAPASAADTANGSSDDSSTGNGAPSFPREIAAAKSALNDQIRLLNIPFAPIIVASGPSCLVAQAYISDHAASGLVLVSPPPDADPRTEATTQEAGWAYPRFTYEPRFPILLVAEPGQEEAVTASRVGSAAEDGVGRGGKGVSIQVATDGPRGEKTRMEVERWMDSCGF
ncbi:uncharacterized protein EHS24_004856 [Apiotrichum porosum]|uniref:Uncharacterized protein n=1 Tax=Apiotrichum porosum TaxID=105984 RepID=A0A427Y668_9TREE|nr:uncharacterized protein EHS24_004856 [Apiotrichum porosum]RSH86587.1 hypothetical protein EHS24_004856 [Apiotrichum porosum]